MVCNFREKSVIVKNTGIFSPWQAKFLRENRGRGNRIILMRLSLFTIALVVWLVLTGCSADPGEKQDYLLKVNGYTIGGDEIDSRLKFEAKLNIDSYLSEDIRTEFIRNLIDSQLLIQEAKKQKLDQREVFRQTIQRYWESTLIRDLLAEKGEQLRKSTVVTQEEVEAYYRSNKEFLPEGKLKDLQSELTKKIEDQKVSARLASWIEELKAGAKIEIKDADLAGRVKSKKSDG